MLPSGPCCARARPPIFVVLPLAALTALLALALTALLAGALAACGDGVDGTCEMTEGEDVMKDFTLTLGGGEFTLSGSNPAESAGSEFKGTYSVEGDKVALDMDAEAEPRWRPDGALS